MPELRQPFLLWVPDGGGSACRVQVLPNDTRAGDPRNPAPSAPVFAVAESLPAARTDGAEAPALGASHVFGFARTNPDPAKDGDSHRSPGPGGDSDEDDGGVVIGPRTEIRGYAIEHELGRGGMGTVYLARQLSLDRPVALKVMSKRWASDPVFVARFTREAFAAAQLSHPNIVQIHDIGETDGARFFSMEYVRGKSLADLVKAQGKLDPETAVGYVLQAARGLKHAHDRGMIHRDVKPDNLLLDEQGLVKVADLGLVKTPTVTRADDQLTDVSMSSRSGLLSLPPEMTGVRIALGTPAYMSPEQCRDAATVDNRADVYSLGCTLYVLVTGRPPFDGTTAVELMSKHAYEPIVPPEQIVSRVPKAVSAVIQRMMAKDADDRYQDMAEVVRTLEAWLGVHHTGTFSPQEEQISRLEGAVFQFNTCGPAVLRGRLISFFFGSVALAAVLLAFFGKLGWAFGVFGLAAQASLAYFVLDGAARRGHLFGTARRFVGGMGWSDLAVSVAGFAMFCLLLSLLKVFWIWAGFGLIGVGLAFALCYAVDRAVHAERRVILDGCERQLRRMRAHGLAEYELRQFVAKFAGRQWEEFFEALFGYDAKLAARAVLLRGGAAGAGQARGVARAADRVDGAGRAVPHRGPAAGAAAGRRAGEPARRRGDCRDGRQPGERRRRRDGPHRRRDPQVRADGRPATGAGHRPGARQRTGAECGPRTSRSSPPTCRRRRTTRSASSSRCSWARTSGRWRRRYSLPGARCGAPERAAAGRRDSIAGDSGRGNERPHRDPVAGGAGRRPRHPPARGGRRAGPDDRLAGQLQRRAGRADAPRLAVLPRQPDERVRSHRGGRHGRRPPVRHPPRRAVPRLPHLAHARRLLVLVGLRLGTR